MMLWQVKENNVYNTMKTPSSFDLDGDDLDNNSYRSTANGNLNRKIIGKKWQSAKFGFNNLTQEECERICQVLDYYPLEVRFKSPSPVGNNGIWEGECYCSKWRVSMRKNKETGAYWNDLTFTLVQGKKVLGQ